MSKKVDERVVEMRFDNAQFENGVKTSMSTLERLKQSLNLKGASKGFENVSSAAKKVNLSGIDKAVDSLKVKFSALDVMAVTALSNITNSAINAGKQLVGAMVDPLVEGGKKRALNIEQAKFQFKGLGMDVEASMESANAAVKGTAYGLDAAAKIASMFGATGMKAGEEMTSALRGVAGVAAMTGSSYEDIGNIFTTVAGNGRLMGDQLLQLSYRGINAAATLGKVLGKTEGEVRDMVSKGKIDFQTFAKAMDDAFGAHAKDANQTFTGALANVRAALSRIGADVAAPTYEKLRDVFNALIPTIDNIHTALTPLIKIVNDVVGVLGDKLVTQIEKITKLFSKKDTGWDNLKSQIADIGISTEEFQNALVETAKTHGIAIDDMIAKNGSFENSLKEGWLTSEIFAETINEFSEGVNASSDSLNDLRKVVDDVIIGRFGSGAERVKALTDAGYDYATVQGFVNEVLRGGTIDLSSLSDEQLKNIGYTEEQIASMKELAAQAQQTGTPINELIESLAKSHGKELIIDSLRNALSGIVKIVTTLKQAWTSVFTPMPNLILNVANAIHNFSSHLVITDETVDKIKRSLQGLFSIFKLIFTFTGGAFRIGFKLLGTVLKSMNINVLDVTAAIGDAIAKFSDWFFNSGILAKGIEKVSNVIKTFIVRIRDFVKEFAKMPAVQKILDLIRSGVEKTFEFFKNVFTEGKTLIEQFIDKFEQLDTVSLSNIFSILKELGSSLANTFSNKKINVVGLSTSIDSLKNGVVSKFKWIRSQFDSFKEYISSFISFIKDKLGSINIGNLLGVAFGASMILFIKKLSDMVESISGIIGSFETFIDSFSGIFDGLTNVLNAKAKAIKVDSIYKIAKAIALLVGSIALLTFLDPKKTWNAIEVLGALAAGLIAFFAVVKLIGKDGSADISGAGLLGMAAAIMLLSITMKRISEMDPNSLQTGLTCVGLLMTMFAMIERLPKTATSAKSVLALSVGILVIVRAIKQIAAIDPADLNRSMTCVGLIAAFFVAVMGLSKYTGKGMGGVGKSLASMLAGILLIAAAMKIFATMNVGDITKGLVCVGLLMGVFTAVSRLAKFQGDMDKGGKAILSMSAAILIISGAMKIFATMNAGDIAKGLVCVGLLMGVFTAVTAVSKYAGEHAAKAGVMLLMMSGAILILSTVIMLLSQLEPKGLWNAVGAIAVLEICLGALIASTKLASNCKGTLISLVVAVGILAAALATLSMLNPDNLRNASLCISALIGVFALLIASTHFAKSSVGTILILTLVVAALGGILLMLSDLPVASALAATTSLTVLLAAITGAIVVLSNARGISAQGLVSVGVLTLVVAALGGILLMLSNIPVASALAATASLTVLLAAITGAIVVLSNASGISAQGLVSVGTLTLVVAALGGILLMLSDLPVESALAATASLTVLLAAITGVIVVLSNVKGISAQGLVSVGALTLVVAALGGILLMLSDLPVESAIGIAISLSTLLLSLSAACAILSIAGVAGVAAFVGIGVLLTLIASLGALIAGIGALVTQFPKLETFLNTGIPILEQIGHALGSFFGNIVGGFLGGMAGGIERIGESLSGFISSLQPFIEGVKSVDGSVLTGVKNLAEAILILVGANLLDKFSSLFSGGDDFDALASHLSSFGSAIVEFGSVIAPLGNETIEKIRLASEAGKALAEFASNIPNEGGLVSKFTGDNSLAMFAKEMVPFGTALSSLGNAVAPLTTDVIDKIKMVSEAGKALTEFASDIPNEGGLVSKFTGDNSLAMFAKEMVPFGTSLVSLGNAVAPLTTDVIDKIKMVSEAGKALTEFASDIPNEGGLVSKFTGDNSLATFAEEMVPFGEAIAEFANSTSNVTPESVSAPIKAFVEAVNSLSQLDTSGLDASAAFLISNFVRAIEANSPQVNSAGNSIGENFAAGLQGSEASASSAGSALGQAGASGVNSQSGLFSSAGTSFGQSLSTGMSSGSGSASSAGSALGQAGASGANSQSGLFNSAGTSFGQSLGTGMLSGSGSASSAGSALGQAGASGASSQSGSFNSIGSNMAAGLAAGIRSGTSGAISAAISLAKRAYDAAKKFLDINSPSRAFMALGNYIGEGLAMGIRNSTKQTVDASEEMARRVVEIAGKSIDDIEEWISTEKHFDNLSLAEELELWEAVIAKYGEGTEERLKAEKNAYTVYKQLYEEDFQNSKDWIDREKEYNRLSLEEEIAAWERVQARYITGTKEREEADKNLYKLRHDLIDGSMPLLEQEINKQKEYLSTLTEGTVEYSNALKELIYLQGLHKDAEYENSQSWIQEQDDFDRWQGTTDKLAARYRVLDHLRSKGDTSSEEYKKTLKEIYDLQKDIYDSYEEYQNDVQQIEEERDQKLLDLKEEYLEKTQEINDKLKEDIDSLNKEYEDAIESRSKALYDSYGLFDKVSKKDKVSASTLMRNLRDQVAEFEDWSDTLDNLSARGLNSALVDELQEMGPSSIAEIRALNSMSDSELQQYANLWSTKHKEAKDRATAELEDMRIETRSKISDLRYDADRELEEYKETWNNKVKEVHTSTNAELERLRIDWGTEVGIIKPDTESIFNNMIKSVGNIMREAGWDDLGREMVQGIVGGILNEANSFYDTLSGVMITGQGEVQYVNQSHSPSKVYMKFGTYMMDGLILGIESRRNDVGKSTASIGRDAIDTMSKTINEISGLISEDMDYTPTIRPVLDMSNVSGGLSWMNGAFAANRSVSLGAKISSTNQNGNNSRITELINANAAANGKIADTIVGIKNDIADLVGKVSRLQVVMDTGMLVGAITPEMDRSLGNAAVMRRRGV